MSAFKQIERKFKTISAYELSGLLDAHKRVVLIDAATSREFSACHICGSVNLPVGDVEERARELIPDRNVPVVLYTGGPGRLEAHTAADKLLSLNYQNVRLYEGGLSDWSRLGLCTTRGDVDIM